MAVESKMRINSNGAVNLVLPCLMASISGEHIMHINERDMETDTYLGFSLGDKGAYNFGDRVEFSTKSLKQFNGEVEISLKNS